MTVTISGPGDLAVELYDRALEPGMTGSDRLRLALMTVVYVRQEWPRFVVKYG